MFDGVTKLEPITTIRVTQFEATPGTDKMQYCGYVNDATLPLGNLASFPKHTVMFRGVEATPHVESFGNLVVRGFMNTYEFAYRINKIDAPGATGEYGWGMAIPVTGFNCKAFNPQQANLEKDAYGQPLKFQGSRLVEPLALPEKVTAGDKVRAMVKIGDPDSGAVSQNPSAQPIPLCEDGEPRAATAQPKVLIWRVLTQPEGNLASLLQLRLQ